VRREMPSWRVSFAAGCCPHRRFHRLPLPRSTCPCHRAIGCCRPVFPRRVCCRRFIWTRSQPVPPARLTPLHHHGSRGGLSSHLSGPASLPNSVAHAPGSRRALA